MYERALLSTLTDRVREPRRFLQVVAGPRQVGKTTLIGQMIDQVTGPDLFVREVAADAVTAPADQWLDQVWADARTALALSGAAKGLLCVDEVQKVAGWSEVVKKNWDADTRRGVPLTVVLSGSSRLLLQEGLSESLAGRFELHHLGHWSYPEMRDAFGFTPQQYAWFGGYPGAAPLVHDEPRFKSYVVGSVVEASLNRDIFLLTRIDKPALLRQLFDLGLSYSGQVMSFTKVLGQLTGAGNTTTLSRYLRLLDQAGLLAGLEKYSTHPVVTRVSSPKFQTHNMALYCAARTEPLAVAQADGPGWGRVVESAVGAHLLAETGDHPHARLEYWRDGNDEVDFVVRWGETVIGLEVKTTAGSTRGLTAFRRRFPEAKTLVVADTGIPWTELVATRLPNLVSALT